MQHFDTSFPIYWTKPFIFSNIIEIVSGLICYRHFFLPFIDQFATPFKIYFTILHAVPLQFNIRSKGSGEV